MASLSLKFREGYPQIHAALSSKELWGFRFALFAFINYLIAVLALNIIAKPVSEWPWLLFSETVALITLFLLGLLVRFILGIIFKDRQPGVATNSMLIIFLGVEKNVVVSIMLALENTFDFGRLARDIFNGVLAGVFIGGLFVVIFGAQLFYHQKLANLRQKRQELELSLANYETHLNQHRELLRNMAKDALKSRFEEIASALGRGGALSQVVGKLKVTIDQGVAPLIGEFNERRFQTINQEEVEKTPPLLQPIRVKPEFHLDSRPIASWIAATVTLCVLMQFIYPADGLLKGALAAISLSILIWLAKNHNFKLFKSLTRNPWMTIFAISLSNGTISAGLASGFSLSPAFAATFFLVSVASAGIQTTFVVGGSVDRASSLLVDELEQTVQGLQKVNLLLQRDRWIEQQKWAKLLHGRVQAILTACIIQISSTKRHSKQLRADMELSLAKALAILKSGKFRKVNFASERKQLIRAWSGVCDVKIEIEPSTQALFKEDENLEYVCNLATKEITSAAFSVFASRAVAFTLFTNRFNQVALRAECENESRLDGNIREQLINVSFLSSSLQEDQTAGRVILSVTFESNAGLLA